MRGATKPTTLHPDCPNEEIAIWIEEIRQEYPTLPQREQRQARAQLRALEAEREHRAEMERITAERAYFGEVERYAASITPRFELPF